MKDGASVLSAAPCSCNLQQTLFWGRGEQGHTSPATSTKAEANPSSQAVTQAQGREGLA